MLRALFSNGADKKALTSEGESFPASNPVFLLIGEPVVMKTVSKKFGRQQKQLLSVYFVIDKLNTGKHFAYFLGFTIWIICVDYSRKLE